MPCLDHCAHVAVYDLHQANDYKPPHWNVRWWEYHYSRALCYDRLAHVGHPPQLDFTI